MNKKMLYYFPAKGLFCKRLTCDEFNKGVGQ
jgi:hypothetical protein